MNAKRVLGPSGGPRPGHGSSERIASLAAELNQLTDLMEIEWNERRIVSSANAGRLSELRRRFERLLEEQRDATLAPPDGSG